MGHKATRVFIMRDTVPCLSALQEWLKYRPFFNSYTIETTTDDATPINLVHSTNPGVKNGKIKSHGGKIICVGDTNSEPFRLAERTIRVHLGWPPVDYEEQGT